MKGARTAVGAAPIQSLLQAERLEVPPRRQPGKHRAARADARRLRQKRACRAALRLRPALPPAGGGTAGELPRLCAWLLTAFPRGCAGSRGGAECPAPSRAPSTQHTRGDCSWFGRSSQAISSVRAEIPSHSRRSLATRRRARCMAPSRHDPCPPLIRSPPCSPGAPGSGGGAGLRQRPHPSEGEGARLLLRLRFFPKRKAVNRRTAALTPAGAHEAGRGASRGPLGASAAARPSPSELSSWRPPPAPHWAPISSGPPGAPF